jgi:hypothetical protein
VLRRCRDTGEICFRPNRSWIGDAGTAEIQTLGETDVTKEHASGSRDGHSSIGAEGAPVPRDASRSSVGPAAGSKHWRRAWAVCAGLTRSACRAGGG